MPTAETLVNPPDDHQALKALLHSLLQERDQQRQRAEIAEGRHQALELKLQQLQQELEWLKKRYYGPRADRLQSMEELGQLLLQFAEQLQQKPVDAGDLPATDNPAEPERELRWVRKRKGRRNLAAFENLPVQTVVHELSPEERACSSCGQQRQEIGAEVSWQLEYTPAHFERIEHVRKKYACAHCDHEGAGAQIAVAEKPMAPIEKGMAGPGLLAYVVTSKFADYLPLYRLEDIFERIGCEISRSTLSVWCGDVADLITPLYELMAAQVRQSHVVCTDDTPMPMLEPGRGKTKQGRMWIYLGDGVSPTMSSILRRAGSGMGRWSFCATTKTRWWPMAMAAMMAWWLATPSGEAAVMRMRGESLLTPRRWRPTSLGKRSCSTAGCTRWRRRRPLSTR